MTNTFSVLSIKRNHSTSSSKKESKLNIIFNKLANSFQSNKKRKPFDSSHLNRRSSISALFDYFRSSEDDSQQCPFANDAIFEHNRYKQQKESIKTNRHHRTQSDVQPQPSSILIKPNNPHIHHRHTQSAISARSLVSRKKKSHIRHYSHVSCISSSNITVNSEDLTAKEFANIAGIRILSENEDDDIDYLNSFTSPQRKICTFCGNEDNEMSVIVTSSRISSNHYNNSSSILLRSSTSSVYNNSDVLIDDDDEPQIWDHGFWQKPGKESNAFNTIEPPPILHELKRNHNYSHQDTYIKKGRFEICLSSNDTIGSTVPKILKPDNMVVEWKRKSRPSSIKQQIST